MNTGISQPEACSSSLPKYQDLLEAARGIAEVCNHLEQLKNQIGLSSEASPVCGEKKPERTANLVTVLNELPNEIRANCTNAHQKIEELQSALL